MICGFRRRYSYTNEEIRRSKQEEEESRILRILLLLRISEEILRWAG